DGARVHLHPQRVEAHGPEAWFRQEIRTGLRRPALVPARALSGAAGAGGTEACLAEGWLHFRNPQGLVCSVRCLDEAARGRFPDLSALTAAPGAGAPRHRLAWPDGFAGALRRVEGVRKYATPRSEDKLEVRLTRDRMALRAGGGHGLVQCELVAG